MARAKAGPARGLVTTVTLPNAKVDKFHAHGCTKCGKRYTDTCDPERPTLTGCQDPKVNRLCAACRNGTERAVWDRAFDPRECCRTSSRLVTDGTEISRYSLGGPGPWFRCKTCSRTHPYDPTRSST